MSATANRKPHAARRAPPAVTAAAVCLAACSTTDGTVSVALTTAPGSHLLDAVETLTMIVTNPHTVTTATRDASGSFALDIDLPATGVSTELLVDGLDASGTTIAAGASPPFPIGALDASITIYMAAPSSLGVSPVMLPVALTDLAGGLLDYGAIVAGGTDEAGAPSDSISIYNAFDHTLISGLPLLAARTGLALGVGQNGIVYLLGGGDSTGVATSSAWRFDTTVAPSGSYVDLGDKPSFQRTGQLAVPLDASDNFLVTGVPPAVFAGLDDTETVEPGIAALPAAGASVVGNDGVVATIFAGASAVTSFRNGGFTSITAPDAQHDGAAVVATPGGKAVVACGGPMLVQIDPATGTAQSFPGVDRAGCAVAATASYLLVAGGVDATATIATTAELFDAATLASIASLPLAVPRTGATALALPNGQILVAGGTDASGAPTTTLELFTPANPE